jgi:predicted DNA-binding transcriptional regulator AlpA
MNEEAPYLLTFEELAARIYNVSVRQLYRISKRPDFPPARSLGPRVRRYVRHEHEKFVASLTLTERPEPQALSAARAAKATARIPAPAPFNGALV